MFGCGWADVHKTVGAGGRNRRTEFSNQRLRDGMAGHADGYRFHPRRHNSRHTRPARQEQGEWSRPEDTRQLPRLLWNRSGQFLQRAIFGDMYDQWIAQWPAFGNKDFL